MFETSWNHLWPLNEHVKINDLRKTMGIYAFFVVPRPRNGNLTLAQKTAKKSGT